MKNRCARFQASIPQGAPLTDYSTGSAGGTAICDGYVAVGNFGPKAPMRAPVKPAVKGIA